MSRPTTPRIAQLEADLTRELLAGTYRSGERFTSARELALEQSISYQTAHRLLSRLCTAGLLVRRTGSGTYLPGGESTLIGVDLFFDVRARRADSFGARLLASLGKRLEREGIPWRLRWTGSEEAQTLGETYFPVVWQSPDALALCAKARRPVLLINERPNPGLEATLTDSVSIDDFFGGVCAAQLFLQRFLSPGIKSEVAKPVKTPELCVLAGAISDPRSAARRDGFLSVAKAASVVTAAGWFLEDGRRVAGEAIVRGHDGIFCANDRLAEAVIAHATAHKIALPPLIGFDDAPIAESLGLTTIAIPWAEFIADTVTVIRQRIDGDTSAARQRILTPHPILRNWK